MPFTLRPTTPDDYPRILEIINSQVREPATLDDLLREDQDRDPADPFFRLGAVDAEDRLIGYTLAEGGAGHRPGEFWCRLRVHNAHQRQGVGSALFDRLIAYARSQGATRLETAVLEDAPEALAWAQRRGFVKEHDLFESTLDLSVWDPAPFQEVVRKAEANGFRWTDLAAEMEGGDSEELFRRYHRFSSDLGRDVPGNSDRPDYPYNLWRKSVERDPKWRPELVLLAARGDRWAALCHLIPANSGGLYNGFTAVHPEFRGNGLALALKVRALQLGKEMGAPYIRTNNHSVNQPMLAVNRKLGYKPLPGVYLIAAKLTPMEDA